MVPKVTKLKTLMVARLRLGMKSRLRTDRDPEWECRQT